MTNFFATRQLRQFARADQGQAIVITALALSVLMLMAGLGVDVGFLRYQKQQMQKAADAGAIAGAAALEYGGGYLNAAYNDAAANGFTNGVNGVNVYVHHPPTTVGDPFYLDTNYVEVIVAQVQPTFFMPVGGFYSVPVSARAVAAATASASGCIYVLDPTDNDTYNNNNGGTGGMVNATCNVYVDSSSNQAFYSSGSGTCTTAHLIGVVGQVDQDSCGTSPKTGITSFTDPLMGLPAPTGWSCHTPQQSSPPTACTYTSPNGPFTCTASATVYADTYCGGIVINSGVAVTFSPTGPGNSTYILAGGGLTVNSGASVVSGSGGVTFFNTAAPGGIAGSINLASGTTENLVAPTSGTLQGILFFQDRNLLPGPSSPPATLGGSNAFIEGALYFPTAVVNYYGNSSANSPYTEIVAWKLNISGNSQFNDTYSGLGTGQSPIHTATLVE